MRELLTGLVDLLFPPTKDALILREAVHTPDQLFQPGIYYTTNYLSSYQHPVVQAAVRENKFRCNRHAATLLGALLRMWHEQYGTPHTRYIPIPLSTTRQRQRGHNQVVTIIEAAGLASLSNTKLLVRHQDTSPQSQLDRHARQRNMKKVFSYNPLPLEETVRQIVVIDDVVTTGATLQAAREAVSPHLPPHVTLRFLAIAH